MEEDIKRWVNTLTKLELAIYDINKDHVNRWLNEFNTPGLPRGIRGSAQQNLIRTFNKGKTK